MLIRVATQRNRPDLSRDRRWGKDGFGFPDVHQVWSSMFDFGIVCQFWSVCVVVWGGLQLANDYYTDLVIVSWCLYRRTTFLPSQTHSVTHFNRCYPHSSQLSLAFWQHIHRNCSTVLGNANDSRYPLMLLGQYASHDFIIKCLTAPQIESPHTHANHLQFNMKHLLKVLCPMSYPISIRGDFADWIEYICGKDK